MALPVFVSLRWVNTERLDAALRQFAALYCHILKK
jgi:hypothetical protein